MAGTLNLFDGVDLTAPSEYASRLGEKPQYLEIHHGTLTSFSGLKSLMAPGGRTVSANGAMSNTGWLDEVVPFWSRAFTSASAFDRKAFTVEVCNTTLGPQWGISALCRERLAILAVALYKAGFLGSLTRAHIIGHNEVPGTYATACPGPDMNLDWIVQRAQQIYKGEDDVAAENDYMTNFMGHEVPVATVLNGIELRLSGLGDWIGDLRVQLLELANYKGETVGLPAIASATEGRVSEVQAALREIAQRPLSLDLATVSDEYLEAAAAELARRRNK